MLFVPRAVDADDVDALRTLAKCRWQVGSQWDGKSLKSAVDDWQADHSAVLVGASRW